MAQYRDDFSGNTPPAIAGWTARFNTGSTTFQTVSDATAEGGVVLRIGNSISQRAAWSMDAPDSESPDTRADCEILFKFKSADVININNHTMGPMLRGSGGIGTETCYHAFLYDDQGEYWLRYFNSGAATNLVSDQYMDIYNNMSNGDWYWCRARINGTTFSVKFWEEEYNGSFRQFEPAYWQYTVTDSTISAAGWIGIVQYSSNAGPWDIAYVGIGTNGDVAPYPAAGGTYKLTQQGLDVLVNQASADVHVTQQLVQVLVQENTPVVSLKRRHTIIGM